VNKSGIVDEVMLYAKHQGKKALDRVGGSKKKRVTGIPKCGCLSYCRLRSILILPCHFRLIDANNAGLKGKSQDCTLILTEGDSAKALAVAGMSVVGRDYYGVFPLRGKPLNVRDATVRFHPLPLLHGSPLTATSPTSVAASG